MLVLLPPSRGKAAPVSGRRAGLSTLAFDRHLRAPRERLLDLIDPALRRAPAVPAAELYTGVLYESLGLDDLPWDGVLIASALWGVVRPGDRIPAYKLDIAEPVPGLGSGLAGFWRAPLAAALPDRGLILDLRSGGYASAWTPRRATVLGVRGFTESADGARTVITHMVKRVRGQVARLVLMAGGAATPADVEAIVAAAGLRAELSGEPGARTRTLDVIESVL